MSVRQLRAKLRERRRSLPEHYRRNAAHQVASLLARQLFYTRARHIAFYVANDGELDPGILMMDARLQEKQCYLPVMIDRFMSWRASPLVFQAHDPVAEELVRNRYGILEPAFDPSGITSPEMLDVIFVPLVGFDRRGNRMGMGKGFYDRTLAQLHRRFRRPKLVGLAYDIQEIDEIMRNHWDIPMDAIATETGLIEISPRG